MQFRFAGADFTFPLLSHEKSLDLIKLLGFEGVDIGLFQDRSHLQPDAMFADIPGNAVTLKRKLEDRGLVLADLFLQMATDFESAALNHPDDGIRQRVGERYLQTLEFARLCGAKHVTLLPGVHFEGEEHESSYARAVDELSWRTERADDADITFAVEAHIGSFCQDPKRAECLVKDVSGLTLTLDYTHFTKLGYTDSVVEPLVRYASHFHARGANGERAQVTLEDNTIDYPRVVRKMAESGYPGWIGIEYVWTEWERMNEVDNVSECIRMREVFEKAAAEL
jgi:sugar phosphate isomerase/epimerase